MFWRSYSILNPEPASDVIWLKELGHGLNDSNQLLKLQFHKCLNILGGYLATPTRMPIIEGLLYLLEYHMLVLLFALLNIIIMKLNLIIITVFFNILCHDLNRGLPWKILGSAIEPATTDKKAKKVILMDKYKRRSLQNIIWGFFRNEHLWMSRSWHFAWLHYMKETKNYILWIQSFILLQIFTNEAGFLATVF